VSAPAAETLSSHRVTRARNGVGLAFVVAGFSLASFASRAPAVKHDLSLSPAGLGLLLVCASIGSMTSMAFTGPLVYKAGTARGVAVGAALQCVGFTSTALGLALDSVVISAAGLFCAGFGVSIWDVSMNVEGAAVERLMRRSVMSRFHAGFSLGTVFGAIVGAALAALGVPAAGNLLAVAVVLLILGLLGASWFTPRVVVPEETKERSRALLKSAWTNSRTLVVGLMVLAFAFTEGVANDWTAVAVVDGLHVSDATGALTFAAFLTAMTAGRLVGGRVIDRWGRVLVLRVSAVVAACGVVLVVVGPVIGVVASGSVLWGLGAALGFPTGMSAAADHREYAAIHVSVVSAIGYTAFLAGPPLVGFLGDRVGIRESLLVVPVALVLAFVAAGAAKPLQRSDGREPR
jgi:MFS family permease